MKRDLNCFYPNSIKLCILCGLYFSFAFVAENIKNLSLGPTTRTGNEKWRTLRKSKSKASVLPACNSWLNFRIRGQFEIKILIVRHIDATLGASGLSCAVSGFGQVLKSEPCEEPLDQSAIPLIASSQLQSRLYQNILNLDVLLISSLEISNVSSTLIELQSQ